MEENMFSFSWRHLVKTKQYTIGHIPAVLYGEESKKGYLFVHGQGGNKEEAKAFAEIAVPAGYQVLGIDLPEHGERKGTTERFNPWTAVPELQAVFLERKPFWNTISLRANSIGAYFSMLAFSGEHIEKALFVSPIVNMEKLILDMMGWAGVTETVLRDKGEIATNFGQTLSWNYLCWVREHPLSGWSVPTSILYAGGDNLTSRETIMAFAKEYDASVEVYEPGEHWFHTDEQLSVLKDWEKRNV
jgi:hypothetical protein